MMRERMPAALGIGLILAALFSLGCSQRTEVSKERNCKIIVASDTLLSGMIASLLPSVGYEVFAILPPAQCPGHYDVKLTDMERIRKADLIVSFLGMPFMEKADIDMGRCLYIDTKGRNWMAPDSHIQGLHILAGELARRFPEEKEGISGRLRNKVRRIAEQADELRERLKNAGALGAPILACALQKESLEWMGFRVVGEYGRPESMSAKDIVRLSQIGRRTQAVLIADNLQSGPEAGKAISDALEIPHVVLTNFPSEKGYESSLGENTAALLAALGAE